VSIVSRSDAIANRRNVTVAEVTRVVRHIASEVPLSRVDGMPSDCVINTDNLHTIPKDRLRERIIALSAQRMFALGNSLRYSLELDW
jgi:mRNA interferase MazF